MVYVPRFQGITNAIKSPYRSSDALLSGEKPEGEEEEGDKASMPGVSAAGGQIQAGTSSSEQSTPSTQTSTAQKLIERNVGEQQGNIKGQAEQAIEKEAKNVQSAADEYKTTIEAPEPPALDLVGNLKTPGLRDSAASEIRKTLDTPIEEPGEFKYDISTDVTDQLRALSSPEGRRELLRTQGGAGYTEGQLALDEALLRARGGTYQDVFEKRKALEGQITKATEDAASARSTEISDRQAAIDALRERLTGAMGDLRTDLSQRQQGFAADMGSQATREVMGMRDRAINELNDAKAKFQAEVAKNPFGYSTQQYQDAIAAIDTRIDEIRRGSVDVGTVNRPELGFGAGATQDEIDYYNTLVALLGSGGQLLAPTDPGSVSSNYTGVADFLAGLNPQLVRTMTTSTSAPGPVDAAGQVISNLGQNLDPTNSSGAVGGVVDTIGQIGQGLLETPGKAFQGISDAIQGKTPTTTVGMNIQYNPDGTAYIIDPVLGRKLPAPNMNIQWDGSGQARDHNGNRRPEFDRQTMTSGGQLAEAGLSPGGIAPDDINMIWNSGNPLSPGGLTGGYTPPPPAPAPTPVPTPAPAPAPVAAPAVPTRQPTIRKPVSSSFSRLFGR